MVKLKVKVIVRKKNNECFNYCCLLYLLLFVVFVVVVVVVVVISAPRICNKRFFGAMAEVWGCMQGRRGRVKTLMLWAIHNEIGR